MDVWNAVAVLVRRWYVAVPVLVLGLGLAGVAWATVPVQYESRAVLALTTPRDGGTQTALLHKGWVSNPLANFDRTLNLTAGIVIREINTASTAERLGVTAGGPTSYEVGNGSATPQAFGNGPFIFVRGLGATPGDAEDIARRVSEAARTVLADRQTELQAPVRTQIEVHLVLAPTRAEALSDGPLRAAALGGALAVLASLAAAYGFESFALSRGAWGSEVTRRDGRSSAAQAGRAVATPARERIERPATSASR